ncbi:MAG: EAL domain-containing protein [Gammaproteobacteria bacterium]|nr:EAL domain-containing protein [Gammaproteobacteria bacterium]
MKAIIKTIIDLAKHLKLTVIAEGVETQAQVNQFEALSCDEIQGYFFSKPIAPKEIESFKVSEYEEV